MTPEQERASTYPKGVWWVLASAGSGKTFTFIQRIANMIKSGIKPYNILAVTFTKKTAEEMQKRLEALIGKDASESVTIGTFHSIANRLINSYDTDFCNAKVAPDWWIMQKLSSICGPYSEKNHLGMDLGIKAGEMATFISYQKANLVGPDGDFVINEVTYFAKAVPTEKLREAYATFERLKEESRYITFEDILVRFYELLSTDEDFQSMVRKKFHYVLIDEFQDTSKLMMKIIKYINTDNLFVVGDHRQSIYSFINADVENIMQFPSEFPEANLVELNKNFRSTQNIVNLSNKIIGLSPMEQYKQFKPSESVAEVGDKIGFSSYLTQKTQAEAIADKIEALQTEGVNLSEIAVLVRTNAQGADFEEVFSDRDIPYVVSKTSSFFDKREILDILSYCRITVDTTDDTSLRRIINTPSRYLTNQFIEDCERMATNNKTSLLTALRSHPQSYEWKFKRGVTNLTDTISSLRRHTNGNAGKFIRTLVEEIDYMGHVSANFTSSNATVDVTESINKLVEMASKFKNVRDFLGYIQVISDKKKKKKKDAVSITTCHSAKGLEWSVTFVVNMNDQLFPHKMNKNIEEERRLFYVACSRPKKKLFVSWHNIDSTSGEARETSPFIYELLGVEKVNEMNEDVLRGAREGSCKVGA
jgi:DNA helicase-2/ATP-dependent DNA helicase PcrA